MSTRDELAAALKGGTLGCDSRNGAIYLEHADGNRDYVTGRPPIWADYIYIALVKIANEKPRTVDSQDELEALPHESVIRDDDGDVYELWSQSDEPMYWMKTGTDWAQPPRLPVTVLFTPGGAS